MNLPIDNSKNFTLGKYNVGIVNGTPLIFYTTGNQVRNETEINSVLKYLRAEGII